MEILPQRLTREELFQLVWSEPISKVASRLGISPAGLKKKCNQAEIPFPRQEYWAARRAGRRAVQPALPPRAPAMGFEVVVGGGWFADQPTDEEILGAVPDVPEFPESLDDVRERMRAKVSRATVRNTLSHPHPAIAKLLAKEERSRNRVRLIKPEPRFETPAARRRLRILDGLFRGLTRAGGRPWVEEDGHGFGVRVNCETLRLRLDSVPGEALESVHRRTKKGTSAELRLVLYAGRSDDTTLTAWQDTTSIPLEDLLSHIAAELLTQAEANFRRSCVAAREWRVTRKRELEEERVRKQAAAERAERERQIAAAKARTELLLAQAAAHRRAGEIRGYAAAVCENLEQLKPHDREHVVRWRDWALTQADNIDPLVNREFLALLD